MTTPTKAIVDARVREAHGRIARLCEVYRRESGVIKSALVRVLKSVREFKTWLRGLDVPKAVRDDLWLEDVSDIIPDDPKPAGLVGALWGAGGSGENLSSAAAEREAKRDVARTLRAWGRGDYDWAREFRVGATNRLAPDP